MHPAAFFFWREVTNVSEPEEEAETIEEIILDEAAKPASASSGGVSVTNRSLHDLIELQKYLDAKALASDPTLGFRRAKIVAPSATGA